MSEAEPDRYHVPALARGLELLSRFSRRTPQLTGAELARDMDLPRASVFRMLHTLERAGYVERVDDSASYRLGLGVLRLGFEVLASMELTEIGHPVITRLRDRTRCSAHLVVRDGREVVFIAKAPGESALFQSVQVGARLPAHATVLGRLLLSDLGTPELERLYPEATLQRFTEHTPRTLAELSRLIAADRKRGWAISEGGFETGISTIAAPVVAGRGHVTAVVSVTVPAQRIDAARAQTLAEQVQEAAAEIATRLTHSTAGGLP
ncbi:MAG: IclR family transcriptional regulator [Betaproteobacteria bacterium]|nr:IclR family transcriptional regulator [Betaproteobacteria bacterium]